MCLQILGNHSYMLAFPNRDHIVYKEYKFNIVRNE